MTVQSSIKMQRTDILEFNNMFHIYVCLPSVIKTEHDLPTDVFVMFGKWCMNWWICPKPLICEEPFAAWQHRACATCGACSPACWSCLLSCTLERTVSPHTHTQKHSANKSHAQQSSRSLIDRRCTLSGLFLTRGLQHDLHQSHLSASSLCWPSWSVTLITFA